MNAHTPREAGNPVNRNATWLAPLTGLAFAVLGVASALIAGQPEGAD